MGIALAIVALVAGLILLEAGADRFTDAVGALALRLRASEGVVGLLTAGGEWEELVVVVLALAGGHPGLAVGNIIGSCIANLTGSMPLGLLGTRPIVLDRSARIYAVVMLAATVLASAFLAGGHIAAPAGGLLVAVFVAYAASILLVIRRGWLRPPEPDDDADDDDDGDQDTSTFRTVATLLIGLVVIAAGAELVVQGAVTIAGRIGLSDYVIGATVVAIGTTLPDKAISLIGGLRGQGGVITANATGSNIFLLTLVLGIGALATGSGLDVAPSVTHVDLPILLGVSALVTALFFRATLHRVAGIVLLVIYVAYLVLALTRGA